MLDLLGVVPVADGLLLELLTLSLDAVNLKTGALTIIILQPANMYTYVQGVVAWKSRAPVLYSVLLPSSSPDEADHSGE